MSALVCWKCGASLRKLGLPLGRFDLCPECRVDLHVCRLCCHYDERFSGDCRKEEADYVTDKEQANYCQYFKPRSNAWKAKPSVVDTETELAALFGKAADKGGEAGPEKSAPPKSKKQQARAELDALFGGDGTAAEEESEEDKARKALDDLFKK